MMSVVNSKKLVVVGESDCGKTTILKMVTQGKFVTDSTPTVMEKFVAYIEVGGKLVQLNLWDTPGEHFYDCIRPKIYRNSDVILLIFSIDYLVSFNNIEEKWYPEVRECCPDVPIILVGNKLDLRYEENVNRDLERINQAPVTTEQGQAMADKINALAYIECSAKSNDDVSKVFELATRAALPSHIKNRKSKVISCFGKCNVM